MLFYSAADLYLEREDAADGSAKGALYQTLPGGTPWPIFLRLEAFCLSGASASQDVEITCADPAP